MKRFEGKSILKKMAVGKVFFYEKKNVKITDAKIEDRDAELKRFEAAREEAKEQLQALYDKALADVGEEEAMIFEVHQMMLDDEDFCAVVMSHISEEGFNAEFAVREARDQFAAMFAGMEDEYFKARAADIKDISQRLLYNLAGIDMEEMNFSEPVILVAQDLAPSETVQMDKSKLLGFVTQHGSANSHTAILARTMNIPAIIGVPIEKDWHGQVAVVDGYEGFVTIDPNEVQLAEANRIIEMETKREELLGTLKGLPTVTKGGRSVELCSNIGNVEDMPRVIDNDAEGIGLFRSEFLYLKTNRYPTEDEQFESYRKVFEAMGGKRVVVRTLDIGADKKVDYFDLDPEENPALGFRAIRICLKRRDVFKTQLRAILRASVYGRVSIMFPMIISVDEVRAIKEIVAEVKAELTAENKPFAEDTELGIMVETPAAAIMSDLLAKEVDFFSIGTNDLSQYTMAIDRQNPMLDEFFDAHHPAVLRLIEQVVQNAHRENIWVGICGELAADLELTETFVNMGVDELSVSASFVLPVREKIRSLD